VQNEEGVCKTRRGYAWSVFSHYPVTLSTASERVESLVSACRRSPPLTPGRTTTAGAPPPTPPSSQLRTIQYPTQTQQTDIHDPTSPQCQKQ